jgi:hypothetical protein
LLYQLSYNSFEEKIEFTIIEVWETAGKLVDISNQMYEWRGRQRGAGSSQTLGSIRGDTVRALPKQARILSSLIGLITPIYREDRKGRARQRAARP